MLINTCLLFRYWQLDEYRPYELVDQVAKVLPSDSSCRQDLVCRQFGDDAMSQVILFVKKNESFAFVAGMEGET